MKSHKFDPRVCFELTSNLTSWRYPGIHSPHDINWHLEWLTVSWTAELTQFWSLCEFIRYLNFMRFQQLATQSRIRSRFYQCQGSIFIRFDLENVSWINQFYQLLFQEALIPFKTNCVGFIAITFDFCSRLELILLEIRSGI